MTDQEIKAIRERCDAATTGPWKYFFRKDMYQPHEVHLPKVDFKYAFESKENADFIAHAREDIPALLDALKHAEAAHNAAVDAWRKDYRQLESEFKQWRENFIAVTDLSKTVEEARDCYRARAEALERAIIWNGYYCALCINRYQSCVKENCKGSNFKFDEARFSEPEVSRSDHIVDADGMDSTS